MKIFVLSLTMAAALASWSGNRLRAKESPAAPQKGKVLILRNENTIEGDIERIGDSYRIRGAKGEAWMPADHALHLAASMPEAYLYLRGRINTDDPDERLRLARWCRLHELREQAMSELRAATALRPDHAPTRRLLERLQQEAASAGAVKPPAPLSAPAPQDALPPVEVTTESLSTFALRVQPILMNTCANCHATGRGGKFHLVQVYEDGVGNRRTTEQNLAAMLRYVNVQQPEASQLLAKAVTDHAHTGQAPLRDRQAAPYRTLENWIKTTITNNPHLRDVLPAPPVATTSTALPPSPAVERRSSSEESEWGADAHPPSAAKAAAKTPMPPAKDAPPASKTANPPPPTAPPDPYDPEPFNQRMHPEANKPGPGK